MFKTSKSKTRLKKAGFLFSGKRLLSHMWPIKVRSSLTYDSDLSLVWFKGELQLSTSKATYSYGVLKWSFKRLFELEVINWEGVNSVLILGYGLGSVVDLIQKRTTECKIVGVEVDSKILAIHNHYFDRQNVTLLNVDARDSLHYQDEKYDLIVIDVYNDLSVPSWAHEDVFLHDVYQSLTNKGMLIFNKVVNNSFQSLEKNNLMINLHRYFDIVKDVQTTDVNHMILARSRHNGT